MGQAPDKNGEEIKGRLRVTFFANIFSNVDKLWKSNEYIFWYIQKHT
jgi:hypothetical protein